MIESTLIAHLRTRHVVAVLCLLLLAVALPLGLWWRASTSSAAFADSEVLENNHLGAATLDIELGDATAGLSAQNLAPGDRVSGQIELVNAGTLPLRYWVTATTSGGALADWLSLDIWETSTICNPDQPGQALRSDIAFETGTTLLIGQPTSGGEDDRRLQPGGAHRLCLVTTLPLTAPNDLQGQRLDVDLLIAAEHDLEGEQ